MIRIAFVFLGVACLLGEAVADEPRTLRVASVQLRSSRVLAENVAQIKARLAECAKDGVRVAEFPECALTGYFEDVVKSLRAEAIDAAIAEVAAACKANRINAVIGSAYREGTNLFNSALIINDRGEVIERYHKVQLAETWPTPGDHLSMFRLDGVPCTVIICHDERYPELVRLPVLAGARVVFYISHESGVTAESKIGPYRAQIQARAVENTVYIVQANAPANKDTSGSHGQSRIIAPDGNILHEASIFGDESVRADLDLKKATADNARKSLTRGPLGDWWKDGIRRVRIR